MMRQGLILATALTAALPFVSNQAFAQVECWMGEVRWFGMYWVPRNYAVADGSLLPISQNPELFALIGTIYGGDGRSNFALPDLRGRVQIGAGTGTDLTPRTIGQQTGSEAYTLDQSELPPHTHSIDEDSGTQVVTSVTLNVAKGDARSGSGASVVTDVTANVTEGSVTGASETESAGGGQSFNITQPSLVLTPGICVRGASSSSD